MATEQEIRRVARKYRLDPRIFRGLVQQESGNNQRARSPAGAIGDTQLMPGTARGLGVNPYNERQNLEGGARYLRQQLDRFGGNYRLALAAYNAGPGAVQKYHGVPPYSQTQKYVEAILGRQNRRAGRSAPGSPGVPGMSLTQSSQLPGINNQQLRQQLLMQYLQQGGVKNSNALLGLAQQWRSVQDLSPLNVQQQVNLPGIAGSQGQQRPAGKLVRVDGKPVAGWIAPILQWARQHGWKGTVTSGYRSRAEQARIYNSGVRPAARPGTSNHEMTGFPGGAVDVTNAQQLSQILQNSPYRGKLVWAGPKDPVHLSHPHNGSY